MSTVIALAALFIVSCTAMEYNVTEILNKYQNFAALKGALQDTGLADQMFRRDSITLLVMGDTAINDFVRSNHLDIELVKKILCVHIILGYYDVERLTKLGIVDRPSTLTTLFQDTGAATNGRGFVNVSLIGEGEIAFGSATPGGTLSSKLVNTVELHPFSLSILQITYPIWVPGIEQAPPVYPRQPPPPAVSIPVSAPAPEDSRSERRPSRPHAPGPDDTANVTAPAPRRSGASVAAGVSVGVAAAAVLLASLLVAN